VHAEAPPESPDKAALKQKVLAAWKAREAKVASFWVKWDATSEVSREYSPGSPASEFKNGLRRKSHKGLGIAWSGAKMSYRYASFGKGGDNRFATNGVKSSDYYTRTGVFSGQATVRENGELQYQHLASVNAVTYLYRPMTCFFSSRGRVGMSVEPAPGRKRETCLCCIAMEDEQLTIRMELDPTKEFVPLVIEGISVSPDDREALLNGVAESSAWTGSDVHVYVKTLVEYSAPSGDIPVLKGFMDEVKSSTSEAGILYRMSARVRSTLLNSEIPESEFDPSTFPDGTLLMTESGEPIHVIGKNGVPEPYVDERYRIDTRSPALKASLESNEGEWARIVFIASLVLLAGGIFAMWLRRSRS
jgi:hypothetical protein